MSKTLNTLARYAKAIGGAAVAGVGVYIAARTDGQVTMDEWWGIIGAALAGGGIVGVVPNAKKKV